MPTDTNSPALSDEELWEQTIGSDDGSPQSQSSALEPQEELELEPPVEDASGGTSSATEEEPENPRIDLEAKLRQLESYEKRYNDLRPHADRGWQEVDRLRKELEGLKAQLEQSPGPPSPSSPREPEPKVEELLSAESREFFEEYGDFAKATRELINAELSRSQKSDLQGVLQEEIEQLKRRQLELDEERRQVQYDAWMREHAGEDYSEVLQSPDLLEFLKHPENEFFVKSIRDPSFQNDQTLHGLIIRGYRQQQELDELRRQLASSKSPPPVEKPKANPMQGALSGGAPSRKGGGARSYDSMSDAELYDAIGEEVRSGTFRL